MDLFACGAGRGRYFSSVMVNWKTSAWCHLPSPFCGPAAIAFVSHPDSLGFHLWSHQRERLAVDRLAAGREIGQANIHPLLIAAAFCIGLIATTCMAGTIATAAEVKLERTDGTVTQGVLESLEDERLQLVSDGQSVSVPTNQLRRVTVLGSERNVPRGDAIGRVRLTDDSDLAVDSIHLANNQMELTVSGEELRIRVPSEHVQLVQLGSLSEEQARAWKAISESVAEGDVLAVRRDKDALAAISGIVKSIAGDKLQFSIDGAEEIPVAFSKLAGIRFFTRDEPALGPPKAVVTDVAGNHWSASKLISTDGETLQLELRCGVEVSLPLRDVADIDFSPGTLKYLTELEPLSIAGEPTLPFDNLSDVARRWFRPRIIASNDARYAGGDIEFVGAGEIAFRLPTGFSRLVGNVELRPSGARFTPCRVRIWVDNDIVWHHVLDEPRRSIPIDCPVRSDARLRLVVEPQSDLPVGATVVMRTLKLLK